MQCNWIILTFFIVLSIDGVFLDDCVCVKLNECGDQDNDIQVDLRVLSECDDYLQTCCDRNKIHPSVLRPGPPRQSCGYANHEGVSFQIVGNINYESQFGEFPWMIAVLQRDPNNKNEFIYQNGGSLIHPNVAITTAARVSNRSLNDLIIRAGEWNRQTVQEPLPHEDRNINEIVIHPDFITSLAGNNIALLFLDRPLDFERHIDTICLPPQNYQFDFQDCFVSGWGETKLVEGYVYAHVLKKRKLSGVSNDICAQAYRDATKNFNFNIPESYMCAGDEANNVVCEGDGGSPLICPIPHVANKYIQVGIVAMGIDCKDSNVPAMYTKLSLYRTWIDNKIKEKFETLDFEFANQ